MFRLDILFKYYLERFTPYPWLLIPFVIAFLLKGFSANCIGLTIYLIISFLFYRLFDDLLMADWDREHGQKPKNYLKYIYFLKKLALVPLFFYLISTFIYLNLFSLLLSIVFILVNITLYRILKASKLSLLISTLKYFFLPVIASQSAFNPWAYIIFLLFLINELISENFIKFSK